MEEPVTIVDREVLKVLSVETRMDILKILAEGGRMPSFISKKLKKSDATIVEHLEVLTKSGLVKKIEQPGKKFVFYTLTDRGIGIVSSKSKRLVIILLSSIVTFSTSIIFGFMYFASQASFQAAGYKQVFPAEAIKDTSVKLPTSLLTETNILLGVSVVLLVLGVIGFALYFREKSKYGGTYE